MKTSSRTVVLLGLVLFLVSFSSPGTGCTIEAAEPMTWPRFDGPQHNRISRETRFTFQWPRDTSSNPDLANLPLWTLNHLKGDSAPLVFNDKLYLASTQSGQTGEMGQSLSHQIFCWNVHGRDPEFVYQYSMPAKADNPRREYSQPQVHPEAKQAPILVGDPLLRQLFSLSSTGELHALDSDLGHLLWKKSLSHIVGMQSDPVSIAPPLIFEQCLVIPVSWSNSEQTKTTNWLVSLDRRNGQVIWAIQSEQSTLPETLPAAISAVYRHQVVAIAQLEPGVVRLVQVRTGKPVAMCKLSDPQASVRELLFESERLAVLSEKSRKQPENAKSPDAIEWWIDLFDLPPGMDPSSSGSNISTGVHKNEIKAATRIRPDASLMTTALLHEKRLYTFNTESLLCEYEIPSGKKLSELVLDEVPLTPPVMKTEKGVGNVDVSVNDRKKEPAFPHLIFADQQLLATSTGGHWCSLDVKSDGDEPAMRIRSCQKVKPVLAIPVLSKGRIYIRQLNELAAIGPIDNTSAASEILEPLSILAKEKESSRPGGIILSPGMQVLRTGWKQKLQVQLYNDRGFFLRLVKPDEIQWSKPRLGKLEKKTGTYFAPAFLPGGAKRKEIEIRATYNTFSARAVIRIDQ